MKVFAYDRVNYDVQTVTLHKKLNINKLLLLRMTVINNDHYGSIIYWFSHELLEALISMTRHELVSVITNFGSNFHMKLGWNYGYETQ